VTTGTTRLTTRAGLVALAACSTLVLNACEGGERQNAPAPASAQPTVGNAPANAQQFVGRQVTLVGTVGSCSAQRRSRWRPAAAAGCSCCLVPRSQ
jgi:hypothetical protein